MKSFCLLLLIIVNNGTSLVNCVKEVFRRNGDVNVAVILRNECNSTSTLTEREQSVVNSAIWTTLQLNGSEVLPETNFGISVHKICNESEEYQTIFDLFQRRNDDGLLGLVTTSKLPYKIQKFCEVLNLNVKETVKCTLPLVKASVALLSALKWTENVTVLAPNKLIVEEFFKISRKEWICVEEFIVYDSKKTMRNLSSGYTVVFGNQDFLSSLIKNSDFTNAIIVPLDDSVLTELPENSYVVSNIRPSHYVDEEENFYTPSPQLFEIASPLVAYVQNFKHFLINCNGSTPKSCLKNPFRVKRQTVLEPLQIANLLKITTSSINYYIYKSDNASLLFVYNIFNDSLTQLASFFDFENNTGLTCMSKTGGCQNHCKNFDVRSRINFIPDCEIRIRTESWVFAFLSISLLGILLSIAILIFLLVSVCRKTVLEGNPVLTLLLLITVMIMFCSILPLSLEGCRKTKESICIGRALATTLSFSAAFSLILSRSILLATASKEIGFMSHIAGPVQAFLCLFIFGVQAALSLQVVTRCSEVFIGYSFVYLLSYNAMLLLLLLCLSPLIVKTQRNYKEGKYFTFAVITVSFFWCFWVPAYIFFDDLYKDAILCFGVVSTASALLGTIFIPRTYLITIAAARDKMTSTLPSLAATTSVIDIYRAGTQPVYDCVNVAAINAVTVARAGVAPLQHPDLYSCPNLPEDDFDERCETPVTDDKVTRF